MDMAEGKAPAPVKGWTKLIVCVLAVVMVLDFISFGTFWMGRAISSGDWTQLDYNLRSSVWPAFLTEAEYFAEQDLPTVNVVLDQYLSVNRQALGNGGPFVDYLFLKIFRVVGFFTYFAGGLVAILFIVAEAYKRNKEKRQDFEKISATTYHFTLFIGSAFLVCFFLLYVFMPSTLVIPGLVNTPVPFVLCTPYPWAAIMTAIAGASVYGMISNFTTA